MLPFRLLRLTCPSCVSWALLCFFALLLATLTPLHATTLRTVAGTGVKGWAGDAGPATAAQINNPFGIVRGPDGSLWFCEYGGQRIRAILSTGVIITVVGNGTTGYSGDGGSARSASLNQPHSIQFDPAGDLYICDIRNHVIRKITTKTGVITTFAGTGKPGDTPDNSPIAGTPLRGPRTLDFDAQGNLWLATREGNQVFRFDLAAGRIHHIAGTGKKGFTGDGGPALAATLNGPKGLTVGPDGTVYLVDTENHAIRAIAPKTHLITTLVGMGKPADGPDGDSPLTAGLARPHGIWVDPDGTIFIGDSENHRLRALK